MEFLLVILFMILVFFVVVAFLSALAVGIGLLLTMCVPSLQLGHGIISGAIVATAALSFFLWFFNAGSRKSIDDDDEDISEPQPVFVIPRDFSSARPHRAKSKKKKK